VVDSILAGAQNDPSEELVLICFQNYLNNEKCFKLPQHYTTSDTKYKYRDIQKDSLRCFLIYIPIQILSYLRHLSSLKKEEIKKEEVFRYVITKAKLLKFGTIMLTNTDLHIV